MIDQKEIQRVQTIHRMLDDAASRLASCVGYQTLRITVDGVTTTYTAEEVRMWPEIKRQLQARIAGVFTSIQVKGVVWFTEDIGLDENGVSSGHTWTFSTVGEFVAGPIVRGFVFYREMLYGDPNGDTIPVLRGIDPAEDASAEFKEMAKRFNDAYAPSITGIQTGAVLNKKIADPYRGHDIAADKLVATLTYEHPTNVRARKVAQLRAELDRPIGFPKEGRSERAMPRSNRIEAGNGGK